MKLNLIISSIEELIPTDISTLSDFNSLSEIEKKYLPLLFEEIRDSIDRFKYEIKVYDPNE